VAKKLAQKSKEPSSQDAGLHVATAMSFGLLWQHMCKGTRFVLFPFDTSCRCDTKSQQTTQLARWLFMQKHRSTQQREDHAEDLELNLSQTSHSFWLHSKACDFHLQTTQKACSFWRGAQVLEKHEWSSRNDIGFLPHQTSELLECFCNKPRIDMYLLGYSMQWRSTNVDFNNLPWVCWVGQRQKNKLEIVNIESTFQCPDLQISPFQHDVC